MKHLFKKLSSGVIGIGMIALSLCMAGCQKQKPTSASAPKDYSVRFPIATAKSVEEVLPYLDSLEQTGTISEAEMELLRALPYYHISDDRQLTCYHLKKAWDLYSQDPSQDWINYAEVAYRYSIKIQQRGRLNEAIRISTEALKRIENVEDFPEKWRAMLLVPLSEQLWEAGFEAEALEKYEKSYLSKLKCVEQKQESWRTVLIICSIAMMRNAEAKKCDVASMWYDRSQEALQNWIVERPDTTEAHQYRGYLEFIKMINLIRSGHPDEAAELYAKTPQEDVLANYTTGMVIPQYLWEAGRYAEAADMYDYFDRLYPVHTLDAVESFSNMAIMVPRYLNNRKCGRTEKALVYADSIISNIDSALVRLRRENASELAVVYQTHEKELELKDEQAKTRTQRLLLIGSAIILLLVSYLLLRIYRHNQELRAKNRSLFEQIEKREQEERDMLTSLQAQPEEALSSDQQLFRRICALMAEKKPYTEETLNRDELAQMLGTNGKYVSQAIHECSHGETVADFITRYRLEHVARLLRTTDEPVNLIGEMSGIPSRATLARLFRNTYGMTCREYRQAAERTTK